MIAALPHCGSRRWVATFAMAVILGLTGCAGPSPSPPARAAAASAPAPAQDPPQHDLLNAVLWMQRAVEYKATALGAFALARIRLDQALADPSWSAILPKEESGPSRGRPPAVIVDIDESTVDNSAYQAWMVLKDTTFDPRTWNAYVNTATSLAIPGAVEFARYADSKGVKVCYISNRTAEEETATRKNMERLGFPMGGEVDTFLMARERPDWGSAKGTRRAYVANDYRVLLNIGDNFADFVDEYRGSEADRLRVLDEHRDRWGREWIMLPNPAYGSFESAPFNHDFKLSNGDRRKAKRSVLDAWPGP
jgi:5'-nucleotidase (lipoprotein e(P4) family)